MTLSFVGTEGLGEKKMAGTIERTITFHLPRRPFQGRMIKVVEVKMELKGVSEEIKGNEQLKREN